MENTYLSLMCSEARDFGVAWETMLKVLDFFAPRPPACVDLIWGVIGLLLTVSIQSVRFETYV